MKWVIGGFAAAAALSLSACATVRGGSAAEAGGIDVNRTHLGQVFTRAQIAVEPVNAADANNPEFRSYAAAVERQLVRWGYTIAANRPASEQIARVQVSQGSRSALTTGWPAGLGPASRESNILATMLDVRIQRRSDGSAIWQGRAVTEAKADTPRPQLVERLAEALFRDFPGESGRTIRAR